MYDPLPPVDSINIYFLPKMSIASRLLPDASPFSMFFQSLLPNFNVQGTRFVAPEALAERNENDPNQGAAVVWDDVANDQALMDDELRLIDEMNNGKSTKSIKQIKVD